MSLDVKMTWGNDEGGLISGGEIFHDIARIKRNSRIDRMHKVTSFSRDWSCDVSNHLSELLYTISVLKEEIVGGAIQKLLILSV